MSWLCAWCKIYGKYPMTKAYHPDNEKGVLTDTGEKICKTCATNWRKGKKKDKQRDKNGTIQETSTT